MRYSCSKPVAVQKACVLPTACEVVVKPAAAMLAGQLCRDRRRSGFGWAALPSSATTRCGVVTVEKSLPVEHLHSASAGLKPGWSVRANNLGPHWIR